jgi:hypothetical protein
VESLNANALDVPALELMCAHEIIRRIDCWVRPAADRIALEMSVCDLSALTKIRPEYRAIFAFDGDGRSTGKAKLSHVRCRNAGGRTPSDTVAQHGGMVDATHHLAARPMIFRNADGVPQLVGSQSEQTSTDGGRANSRPGP